MFAEASDVHLSTRSTSHPEQPEHPVEQVIDLLKALHILLDCGGTADDGTIDQAKRLPAGRARAVEPEQHGKGARYE